MTRMRKNKLKKKNKTKTCFFFGKKYPRSKKRENFNQIANKALDF